MLRLAGRYDPATDPQAGLLDTKDGNGQRVADLLINDWIASDKPEQAANLTSLPQPVRLLDARDPEPPDWSVSGLIESGEVGLIVGQSGVMKTTLALHCASAIAGGHDALGHFPTVRGPVLYVSEEDSEGRIRNRVLALARGHGWGHESLSDLYLLARSGVLLEDAAWQEHLLQVCDRLGVRAVFFDPFRDLTLAPENDNTEVAKLIRFARQLSELPSQPSVVFLHHFGKGSAEFRREAIERVRGASALTAAARFVIALTKQEQVVKVEVLKMTDAEPHRPFAVRTKIVERDDYPGLWSTARFDFESLEDVVNTEAELAVLDAISETPGMTANGLKDAVLSAHSNLKPQDILNTRNRLERQGIIRFEEGSRSSKLWYAVTGRSEETPSRERPGVAPSATGGNAQWTEARSD